MNQPEISELKQLDRTRWEQWRAIEADGNPGFFNTIVLAFIESTPGTIGSLRSMSERGDAVKARTYAHSLRSSCEVVGAMNLAQHFHQMELALKTESVFPNARALTTACQALDEILVELKGVVAGE